MTKTRRLHVQAPRTAPGRAACAAQAAATLAVAALLLFAGAARAESIGVQGATSADVVLERTSTAASAMGKVSFDGRDAADNAETYAAMQADLEDATNGSEDARLVFKHMVDGAPRESLKLEPEGATVQGETVSIDTDLIPNGDFSDGGTGWSGGTDS